MDHAEIMMCASAPLVELLAKRLIARTEGPTKERIDARCKAGVDRFVRERRLGALNGVLIATFIKCERAKGESDVGSCGIRTIEGFIRVAGELEVARFERAGAFVRFAGLVEKQGASAAGCEENRGENDQLRDERGLHRFTSKDVLFALALSPVACTRVRPMRSGNRRAKKRKRRAGSRR